VLPTGALSPLLSSVAWPLHGVTFTVVPPTLIFPSPSPTTMMLRASPPLICAFSKIPFRFSTVAPPA